MELPILHAELKTLRLSEPFRIAHGTSAERTVLRLRCGNAVGEAPFVPYYQESVQDTLRWIEALAWHGADIPPQGPRAGRLALDLLRHDLIGKQRNQTLGELWQLDAFKAPPGGRSLGIPADLETFAEKVRDTARQFRVLKLKLGSGNTEFDEAIAARAREVAPNAFIFADANGGWSAAEAARLIPRLASLGLKFVEQPIHHQHGLEGWKELRALLPSSPLPLFADESAQRSDDVIRLNGMIDGVNVKLLKGGSFAEARNTIRTARELGMKVMLGCMIESSIGVTAAAHLAPLADWIDLDGNLYVANDDYEGMTYDANGAMIMPKRPGLGVMAKSEP
jgi:L-alanine-DL-glutamate epimerase-like enolase superfamily enzyme